MPTIFDEFPDSLADLHAMATTYHKKRKHKQQILSCQAILCQDYKKAVLQFLSDRIGESEKKVSA